VGLFNPFFDRATYMTIGGVNISGGFISMLTLMGKGVLCLMASFLLVATTRIDALCRSLRKLHVPSMLVTLFLLTFRYVSLMVEEVSVMSDAYALRAPGQKGIHYKAWGSFLGQLLLRSMDRAQELYTSMQLRGFEGEFRYADEKAFTLKDALFLIICVGLFLLVRHINLTQLLGEAVVGMK
jgi:cobalt/nickel transport system permease protein